MRRLERLEAIVVTLMRNAAVAELEKYREVSSHLTSRRDTADLHGNSSHPEDFENHGVAGGVRCLHFVPRAMVSTAS